MDSYIEWSKVPKRFVWAAVDSGEGDVVRWSTGSLVGFYDRKPEQKETWWEAGAGHGEWIEDESAIIGPLPPWKDSLIERPKARYKD